MATLGTNKFEKSMVGEKIDNFKREVLELGETKNLNKENLINLSLKYDIGLNDREMEYFFKYFEKNDGNISSFMTMNLFENLSLKEKEKFLSEEINKFDLEKFLLNKTDCEAGVLYIDDDFSIVIDCFTTKYTTAAGDHASTVKSIYEALKNERLDFVGYPFWQKKIMDEKIILGQLCSKEDLFSVLWIPDDISLEQYNYLVSFNLKLKEIYLKNQSYFDNNPFVFVTDINNGEVTSINGIDEIIEILGERFKKRYNVR